MDTRKLMLTNCFSYKELLTIKNLYVRTVLEVYGQGGKVANNETFENYILVLADTVSSTVFILIMLGGGNTGTLIYLHGLTRGPFVMFIISMVLMVCVVIRNGKVKKVKIKITIKLIKLRLRMFIFRISLP